jgi:hypothetical protein
MGTIATNVGEKRRAPGVEENILSHSQMIQVISKVEETQALDTFLLAPNSATTSAPTHDFTHIDAHKHPVSAGCNNDQEAVRY